MERQHAACSMQSKITQLIEQTICLLLLFFFVRFAFCYNETSACKHFSSDSQHGCSILQKILKYVNKQIKEHPKFTLISSTPFPNFQIVQVSKYKGSADVEKKKINGLSPQHQQGEKGKVDEKARVTVISKCILFVRQWFM